MPGALAATLLTLAVGDVLKLRRSAERDDLTDLYNRRAFLDRSARLNGAITVLLMDIDHFKAINDRFGHAGGDIALRHVAAILRSFRHGDRPGNLLVGRLGGEEFGLVLTGISEDAGIREADRLRQILATSPLRLVDAEGNEEEVRVTASFGVASSRLSDDPQTELLSVIRQADLALYAAKGAGRNRAAASGRRNADVAGAARALSAAAAQMRAFDPESEVQVLPTPTDRPALSA